MEIYFSMKSQSRFVVLMKVKISILTIMFSAFHKRRTGRKHVTFYQQQASYLIYLDCRGLGLTQEELVRLFVDKAHLALNDGTMFGEPGKGFMRLNIGCPRSVLEQALKQLETAVADK